MAQTGREDGQFLVDHLPRSTFSRVYIGAAQPATGPKIDDKTSAEIAEALYLSPQTVTFHRKNIRRKLGLSQARSQPDDLLLEPGGRSAWTVADCRVSC
jgi:hypothetical protein